jgi:hypothetical protein
MAISATFMAVLGLSATFLPQEALTYAGYPARGLAVVFVQVTGALFLGFAFLNWMARGTLIGGIYSRPVAIGNFMHFAMVTIVLLKASSTQATSSFIVATVIYAVLAVWFGAVLFTPPLKRGENHP